MNNVRPRMHMLNVYFYARTYGHSAVCTRTKRTYLWSASQRGARPGFQSVHPRAINYAPVRSGSLGSEAMSAACVLVCMYVFLCRCVCTCVCMCMCDECVCVTMGVCGDCRRSCVFVCIHVCV